MKPPPTLLQSTEAMLAVIVFLVVFYTAGWMPPEHVWVFLCGAFGGIAALGASSFLTRGNCNE